MLFWLLVLRKDGCELEFAGSTEMIGGEPVLFKKTLRAEVVLPG